MKAANAALFLLGFVLAKKATEILARRSRAAGAYQRWTSDFVIAYSEFLDELPVKERDDPQADDLQT